MAYPMKPNYPTDDQPLEEQLRWMRYAGLITGGNDSLRLRSRGRMLMAHLQAIDHAANAPVEDDEPLKRGDRVRFHSGGNCGTIRQRSRNTRPGQSDVLLIEWDNEPGLHPMSDHHLVKLAPSA